jgi:hypothetical protein
VLYSYIYILPQLVFRVNTQLYWDSIRNPNALISDIPEIRIEAVTHTTATTVHIAVSGPRDNRTGE